MDRLHSKNYTCKCGARFPRIALGQGPGGRPKPAGQGWGEQQASGGPKARGPGRPRPADQLEVTMVDMLTKFAEQMQDKKPEAAKLAKELAEAAKPTTPEPGVGYLKKELF